MDYVAPEDMIHGKGNILMGTRAGYAVSGTSGSTGEALPVNSGAILTNNAVFNLNLISLIGSLSATKYIPLFAMTAAPLRLEIQLVGNVNRAVAVADAGTDNIASWSLNNVEYVGEFLELSDSAISTIMAGAQSPLQYVLPSFRNYQWTASVQTGIQVSMPVPAKFSSLKSLFVTSRVSADANGAVQRFPLASIKNGLSSFQFRIGSQVVPSKAPSTDPEFAVEAFKCFASIADLNHQPSIDLAAFTAGRATLNDAATAAQTNSGSFLIGLDCEVYAGADKNAYFAGLNTNTDDVYMQATYGTATTLDMRYDAFANYDQVLVCENGVAYVRF